MTKSEILANEVRIFLEALDEISKDESWGWAMNEMHDEINEEFVKSINRMRVAVGEWGRVEHVSTDDKATA